VIGAIVIGVAAGMVAGMLGVGGGILFVPGLVLFLGLTQVDAEATSLLAIVPVAALGAWRQHRYGNLRLRDGLVIGVLALPAAAAGVALVNALPERVIQVGFACLMLVVAAQLGRRALASPGGARPPDPAGGGPRGSSGTVLTDGSPRG
jgi:uncharacterized membrane protein YfcA